MARTAKEALEWYTPVMSYEEFERLYSENERIFATGGDSERFYEFMNVVFDTLASNNQYPTVDPFFVGDCQLDTEQNIMTIEYAGHKYELIVKEIK